LLIGSTSNANTNSYKNPCFEHELFSHVGSGLLCFKQSEQKFLKHFKNQLQV
jgi:hypothetical protein